MDKNEFYKRYENWCDETFNLGHEAISIIEEFIKYSDGQISYEDLYDNSDSPDWIYLENDLMVNQIYDSRMFGIQVQVQDEYGDTFSKDLEDLSLDDRINIASQLIERELTYGTCKRYKISKISS